MAEKLASSMETNATKRTWSPKRGARRALESTLVKAYQAGDVRVRVLTSSGQRQELANR